MFLILFCLTGLLILSTMGIEKPFYDLETSELLFEEFIANYNKSYPHPAEKQRRYEIFRQNLKEINNFNSKSSEAIHGVNQFTDMTNEEFDAQYNSCLPPLKEEASSCKVITDAQITTNEAPESLDYRQKNFVTSVKNQNPCNNCWAFAIAGSMEAQYALKYRRLTSLSVQQLMDCLKSSNHCDVGSSMIDALSELISTPGIQSDSDYPYAQKDLPCRFDQTKALLRVTDCINFDLRDENKLKEALYKYGPIAIAVYSRTFNKYHGGIYGVKDCPARQPGHAVLLVGYGSEDGRDFWIVKNSWGSKWGEEGYIRLARGENSCGIMNKYAVSAIIA